MQGKARSSLQSGVEDREGERKVGRGGSHDENLFLGRRRLAGGKGRDG